MRTVADIIAAMDTVAPFNKAAGWDRVGLQVGDIAAPAKTVGVCHEVTESVVDEAVSSGVDALVAYHPLLFESTTTLTAGTHPAGRAYSLARRDIALIVTHTAFDVAPGGTADSLASTLGLDRVRSFGPSDRLAARKVVAYVPAEAAQAVRAAMTEAGAGVLGHYRGAMFETEGTGRWWATESADPHVATANAEGSAIEHRIETSVASRQLGAVLSALLAAHPYDEPVVDVFDVSTAPGMIGRVGEIDPTDLEDLAARVGRSLNSSTVRVAGKALGEVRRVAVVPGSGADFIDSALDARADVLVTGDVTHHRAARALSAGLAIVDPGHIPTERPGLSALVIRLGAVLGEQAVDLTTVSVDPWQA